MNINVPNNLTAPQLRMLRLLFLMASIDADDVKPGDSASQDIILEKNEKRTTLLSREELDALGYALDRKAEINPECRDRLGLVRADLLETKYYSAIINETADRMRGDCGKESEPSIVALSHDVDRISAYDKWLVARRFIMATKFSLKGRFRRAMEELGRFVTTRSSYNDLLDIMKLEESHGYRSTFFFLIGKGGRYGARYSIKDVKPIILEMDKQGWEVGLHLNFYSWHDEEAIRREKGDIEDVLGHSIVGCRAHYLHFDDATLRLLEKTGFSYDASVGFADDVAFRSGIAAPYHYFPDGDVPGRKGLVEIPLSHMDCAGYECKGWDNLRCENKLRELFSRYSRNATLSFLWHSATLSNPDCPGWGDGYRSLLGMIKSTGVQVKLHKDIAGDYREKWARQGRTY